MTDNEFKDMLEAVERLLDADERRIRACNELDSVLTTLEEAHERWPRDILEATIHDLQEVLRILDRERQLID